MKSASVTIPRFGFLFAAYSALALACLCLLAAVDPAHVIAGRIVSAIGCVGWFQMCCLFGRWWWIMKRHRVDSARLFVAGGPHE